MDSQVFWSEFLEMYKSLPSLWKVKSKNYNNPVSRAAAYNKLVDKLKEIDPQANMAKVKQKIHIFRTNYRRELRKIKSNEIFDDRAADVFQSTLWYFHLLHFLADQEIPSKVHVYRMAKRTIRDNDCVSNRSNEEFETPVKQEVRENKILKVTCEKLKEGNDAKSWVIRYEHNNKVFWTEFLEMYKSLTVLWNVKNENYSNRLETADAYDKLVDKLKEIDPQANRMKVKKKIHIFRTNYRRELRKIRKSEEDGASAEDVFQSNLWYFDLLHFLADQEIPGKIQSKAKSTMSEDDSVSIDDATISILAKSVADQEIHSEAKSTMSDDDSLSDWFKEEFEPPLKRKMVQKDKILKMSCKKLKERNEATSVLVEDRAFRSKNNHNVFWSEFLEMYKSLPVLWKVNNENYCHPVEMSVAYDKLVDKLKEIDPHANRMKVKKKIHIFRTNYRRELRKIRKRKEAGDGADIVFQSNLWYFDLLHFLADQETPSKVFRTVSDDECVSNDDATISFQAEGVADEELHSKVHSTMSDDDCVSIDDATISFQARDVADQVVQSKAKSTMSDEDSVSNDDATISFQANGWADLEVVSGDDSVSDGSNEVNEDEILKMAYKKLKQSDDDTLILAKSWASQYAELSNEQRVLARTIWADVLFHGCMNNLTKNMVEGVHHVLKGTSNASTQTLTSLVSSTPCYENYSYSSQPQSSLVGHQQSDETLITYRKINSKTNRPLQPPIIFLPDPLLPTSERCKDTHRPHQI